MICLRNNGNLSMHIFILWYYCLSSPQWSDSQVHSCRHNNLIKAVQTSGSQCCYTKTFLNNSHYCTYPNFQSCPPFSPVSSPGSAFVFYVLAASHFSFTSHLHLLICQCGPRATHHIEEFSRWRAVFTSLLLSQHCFMLVTAQHSAPHCLVLSITIYLLLE